MVIELHSPGPDRHACSCNQAQCNYTAMEYWQANFDAIKTATANGVTVVEAAGNGSSDLDGSAYGGAFNRSTRDSGAILVGASASSGRTPACFTNYGSRIDAHGWGENVVTTGYGDLFRQLGESGYYTARFGGTSSATPIVVGSVAAVQGVSLAQNGTTLGPAQIRQLLASTATPQSGELSRRIAGLPNLRAAIESMQGTPQNRAPVVEAISAAVADRCVTVQGRASDADGQVSSVEVRLNGTARGSVVPSEGAFQQQVCGLSPGQYVASAIAVDDRGARSAEVSAAPVTVQGEAPESVTATVLQHYYARRITYQQYVEMSRRLGGANASVTLYRCSGTWSESPTCGSGGGSSCVTAANTTHVSSGRAQRCGSLSLQACAIGTGDNLGYHNSYTTTSLRQNSATSWSRVASCQP